MANTVTRTLSPDWTATKGAVAPDTAGTTLTETPSVAQSIRRLELNPPADITMTATPTIDAGYDGQVWNIVNVSADKTIVLQDKQTLVNSGLTLLSGKVSLGPGQGIIGMYSAAWGSIVQLSGQRMFTSVAAPSATGLNLSALQSIADTLFRTGAAGGALIDTTATGPAIIAALASIPYDGTFVKRVRVVNSVGFQITYTANATGVTVSGTPTIADGTWRDFDLKVASSTTVVYTNAGAGTV